MTDATYVTPLVQIGPEDEALPDTGTNLERNYAEDEATLQWLRDNLTSLVQWVRDQRVPQEQEWAEIRRMGLLKHDQNRKYIGRSEAYLPTFARARDVLVSSLTRGLFPSDEFFDVTPINDQEDAGPVKDYLQYELEKCAKVRSNIKPALKQFIEYGIGIAKVWYHKELESFKRLKPSKNALGQPTLSAETDKGREGVRFQTRDIFSVYVWPPTVDQLDQASLVFEDISLPVWLVKELGKKKGWANLEQAIYAPDISNKTYNDQSLQLENMNESTIPTQPPAQGDVARNVVLTECYLRMKLPKAAYLEGDEPDDLLFARVLLAGTTVLEVVRFPFWHGKFPYLVMRATPEPGQFYPKGAGYTAKSLQYIINDFANQINDNMTYGLNPIAIMNAGALVGPPPALRPGVVINSTDPNNAVRFDRPPVEQVQYGQMVLSMMQSQLTDNVGAPPIIQGTNAGKGARTATSSQILQKNANNPIQDMIEDIENEVMMPLLEMAHSLGQQYRTQDVAIPVDGGMERITPDMLAKDCQYRWLASSQAANQQQQTQQLLMLLQSIMPLIPLLQQQGKTVDPTLILRKVWTSMGQRNFDQLITQIGMPMLPGAPDGAPNNTQSAGIGPQDMQTADPNQNQNDEFASVRDQADQMSAMMGQFGGGEE